METTTNPEANMIPFQTTNIDALRTLSTEKLERRLAIMRAGNYPLRYRVALTAILNERENLDHVLAPV